MDAIDLVEEGDWLRAARLYDRLGRYLHESGRTDAALSACERVVELVPAHPPSAERAQALASLAHGLMLAWRFDESLAVCEQALPLAQAIGADAVTLRLLLDLGNDLAYVGRAEEGIGYLRRALELAEESGDPVVLLRAYVSLTDVLTMLGRPSESARVAERGLDVVRRLGIDSTVLVANSIEALLAIGEWDKADSASAAAVHAISANFPYMLLMLRADIEIGRGDFEAARSHLDAALDTLREDRGLGIYEVFLAELALWERRWTEAHEAVHASLARAHSRQAAQLRVWFCAKGLRAQAELAALARARRDAEAVSNWLTRAQEAHHSRPSRGRRGLSGHPECRGLARPGRGRVRARPRRRPARIVVGGSRRLGKARAPARRGVLPLASGRGARRGRRLPHRGDRGTPGGAFCRGSDRSHAPASGTRGARPTCPARSRAGGRAPRGEARPGGGPRPDPT